MCLLVLARQRRGHEQHNTKTQPRNPAHATHSRARNTQPGTQHAAARHTCVCRMYACESWNAPAASRSHNMHDDDHREEEEEEEEDQLKNKT